LRRAALARRLRRLGLTRLCRRLAGLCLLWRRRARIERHRRQGLLLNPPARLLLRLVGSGILPGLRRLLAVDLRIAVVAIFAAAGNAGGRPGRRIAENRAELRKGGHVCDRQGSGAPEQGKEASEEASKGHDPH
jgi:hypothetical protein